MNRKTKSWFPNDVQSRDRQDRPVNDRSVRHLTTWWCLLKGTARRKWACQTAVSLRRHYAMSSANQVLLSLEMPLSDHASVGRCVIITLARWFVRDWGKSSTDTSVSILRCFVLSLDHNGVRNVDWHFLMAWIAMFLPDGIGMHFVHPTGHYA